MAFDLTRPARPSTVARPYALPAEKPAVRAAPRGRRRVELAPYLFVLPSLLLLVIWAYYPLLDTVRLSFFDGTLLSGPKDFVGFKNYGAVLATPEFQKSLANTVKYIIGMIPLAVILPLAVALLAADIKGRMRDVYRSIIFMPMIMAPVVVSLIWLWMLNPLQGVLNQVLKLTFGFTNVNWLGDESTAIWVIVFITGWKILGFSFILYAAAITGIDRSYMDAARMDGASEWQITRRIIFPLLTPTFYFLLLFTILFAGQWAFAPINVLTQGNPNNSTSNVFYILYQIAFQYFNVGQAAAASVMVFLVMGAGILFGTRLMDQRSHFDN
jgi:multiple sugar transport system permease protein